MLLSIVVDQNTSNLDSDGGYHGYWATDLYSINSNYGTADDLKALVSAAHDKVFLIFIALGCTKC